MGEMIILRDGVKRVEVGHGDVIREREREERKPGSVRHFGERYVARRHHSRRVKFCPPTTALSRVDDCATASQPFHPGAQWTQAVGASTSPRLGA